ncbi:predicted protein [Arabidopsis lyrata subsp. lyrata]|uniref:Predicted protein n=1 Tax=Arabidopsis lyrata subsp. lyrata TaxID=81972 RepID=D7MX90_ARALL|nr:predicted protein [Arabidopsis lyrata subsp. lyrata]
MTGMPYTKQTEAAKRDNDKRYTQQLKLQQTQTATTPEVKRLDQPSKIAKFKRGERRVEETHTVKRRPDLRPHHPNINLTRTRTSFRPSSPPKVTDAGEQTKSKEETSPGAEEATGHRSQI